MLRQVHSIFKSEFSKDGDLMLSLSISSILCFPEGRSVAAYVFFLISIFYSIFPLITFLECSSYGRCDQSSWQFFFFIVCRIFSSPPWHFVIVHFSHDQSNWSSLSFSSTTFQNYPGISDRVSGVPKFQHHTKLYSKCSTVLVSSLHLTPLCRCKRVFFRWKLLLSWRYWI